MATTGANERSNEHGDVKFALIENPTTLDQSLSPARLPRRTPLGGGGEMRPKPGARRHAPIGSVLDDRNDRADSAGLGDGRHVAAARLLLRRLVK